MKRTLTVIIALTVLVWSCSHKSTPTASTGGTSPNTGSVVNAPAAQTGAVTTTNSATAAAVVPSTPQGTRSPADAATKSPEMLGQATFNAKCGRCHGLKIPGDYTVDRWIGVMQDMARRANLSDTEKENVLAYVKANAKK